MKLYDINLISWEFLLNSSILNQTSSSHVPSQHFQASPKICGSRWDENREPNSLCGVWKHCEIQFLVQNGPCGWSENHFRWAVSEGERWVGRCWDYWMLKNRLREVWELLFEREDISHTHTHTLSEVRSWEIHLCVFRRNVCRSCVHRNAPLSFRWRSIALCLRWLDQARLRS